MYLSYFGKDKVQGDIEMKTPIHRLGFHTDINNQEWHVRSILGNTVCAVPAKDLHEYYKCTACRSFGTVQQKWRPYRVKINGEYKNI